MDDLGHGYDMNSHLKDVDHQSIRARIMDAAQVRFRTYGPGKTTMAEIAGDLDMSAANLYRYFKNKHELAEECAWYLLNAQLEQLRNVIQQPSVSAALRLQEFVLTVLQQTHERIEKELKFDALLEYVTGHGSNLMLHRAEVEQVLIKELLSQAKASGEFIVSDTEVMAQTIHTTVVFFEAPDIFAFYSMQQLVKMVQHSIELFLYGLLPR